MQAIQTTFQHDAFTPVEPIALPEGFPVTLWFDPASKEVARLRDEDRAFLDQLSKRRAEVFHRLAE